MKARVMAARLWVIVVLGSSALPAVAQDDPGMFSPRWMYELRGGRFLPALDLYETFYGSDEESYVSFAFGYRLRDWLEVGGELGRMRSTGVGILTGSMQLGGEVSYTLIPVNVYASFVFQRNERQRVVPYASIGLTSAYYEQDIDLQPTREGRSDVAASLKAGVRFFLTSQGRRVNPGAARRNTYWRSYVFVEAQTFKAKVDEADLGGDVYQLGFRMEFDVGPR